MYLTCTLVKADTTGGEKRKISGGRKKFIRTEETLGKTVKYK